MDFKLLTETRTIKLELPDGGLTLKHGGVLKEINVAYETCGTLSPQCDNVIFIAHALTGDAHVAGWHAGDTKLTGWWSNMVCPGGGIDTDRFYVVCANVLGGCMGTTGPSSINPDTGKPYGSTFPELTISDMVDVHKLFLDQIGIKKLYAIVGGSFGGMQALDFITRYPDFVENAAIIASGASLTTQALAFDIIGREAIVNDPNWRNGDYYDDGKSPDVGLSQARKLAHVTYISNEMMKEKFGRRRRDIAQQKNFPNAEEFRTNFEVANYLEHQGEKFINRFDANSYLHITRATDEFDMGAEYGSLSKAFESIKSKVLVVALSGDWLFLPSQSEELTEALFEAKKRVSYFCLNAPAGHDAFLTHITDLVKVVSNFLTKEHPAFDPRSLTSDDRKDYDQLIKMLPENTSSVLDVACANGMLMSYIKSKNSDVKCTGVDIDLEQINHALAKNDNAVLANVDAGLEIIPDNAFDCAILSESLQVMREPDKVLLELLRIAPTAIVSFPNFGMWSVLASLMFRGKMPKTKRLPYEWYNTPNIHLCTIRDFVQLCKDKNIKIEKVSYQTTLFLSKVFVALGMKNLGASRVLVKLSRGE
ncbi:MAG: homoserine O-acetyltransferase [Kiritimatiellae bacterium]|nr:homoserine O-acetyltransferase [Kiritimatiellia bacterium]